MKIINLSYPIQLSAADSLDSGQAVAVGYFDGVHLGHQQVIRRAVNIAKQQKLNASVMTFHPHPKEVLSQLVSGQYLTPLEKKLESFAALGVDCTYIVSFDRVFSKVTPEQFVQQVLFPLNVRTVVVGFNFTFGHLGKGTPDTLAHLGGEQMKVEVVEPFYFDNDKVSSTIIREHLQHGEIEKVNKMLGRPYSVSGTVVHGAGRGRTIGIPTANMEADAPYLIPCNGVYAVKVRVGGRSCFGVINVGVKPTFSNDGLERTLEVHIFDFDSDIYGETITVEFISFLRQERKFSSVDELILQIEKDKANAKNIFQMV